MFVFAGPLVLRMVIAQHGQYTTMKSQAELNYPTSTRATAKFLIISVEIVIRMG